MNNIVKAYISGKLKRLPIGDTVENNNKSALRNTMEMLNTLSHGAVLPDHLLKLKKVFIVMLFRSQDHESQHVNGVRYIEGNMPVMFYSFGSQGECEKADTGSTTNQL